MPLGEVKRGNNSRLEIGIICVSVSGNFQRPGNVAENETLRKMKATIKLGNTYRLEFQVFEGICGFGGFRWFSGGFPFPAPLSSIN